ncbi:hypothetical protein GCM10017581_010040 [Dactylosporangium matsuzakiense]|uniref:Uncharacterized protein n=1 Tax=Dactylosporangium matsuzakiense TaxID=53360 RepID=A0A9W6NJH7_9ACTN|nr:hypothetical protein GCM10017581_010040 [Dactylosporangium matsuzakiense]
MGRSCILYRVGVRCSDEPLSIKPGLDEGEESVATVCAKIPVDDGGGAVVLIEEDVRRREIDVHQVDAGYVAWFPQADAMDLIQHPTAALAVHFQSLMTRRRTAAASKVQRWCRHVGSRGKRSGETVVDLDKCVDPRGGQTARRGAGQPLLDERHPVMQIDHKIVPRHR